MGLPGRQQRLLEAIDHQLTDADPHLARLLGAFGQLWACEHVPAREQLPARASRLWSFLRDALAASAWPVPLLTDPPVTDAAGRPRPGRDATPPPG